MGLPRRGRRHRGLHSGRPERLAQIARGVDRRDRESIGRRGREVGGAAREARPLAQQLAIAVDAIPDHARTSRARRRPAQIDLTVGHAVGAQLARSAGRLVPSHHQQRARAASDVTPGVRGGDCEPVGRREAQLHTRGEPLDLLVHLAAPVDPVALELSVAGLRSTPLEYGRPCPDVLHREPSRPERREVLHALLQPRRARRQRARARYRAHDEHVLAARLDGDPDRPADHLPHDRLVAIHAKVASPRRLPGQLSGRLAGLAIEAQTSGLRAGLGGCDER